MALDATTLINKLFGDSSSGVILEIDLDRGLLRSVPQNPVEAIRSINTPTMGLLARTLRQAAKDPKVAGLVVHIGTCPISPSAVDELGDLITRFGQAKPTVAYAESFGELTSGMFPYRLATAAKEIWLQPSGAVVLGGTHLDLLLLRGGFEKLGLDPQFSQRKEYKSAAEQLAGREISDAHREMMQRIADSLVEESIAVISERRRLGGDVVRAAVERGPIKAADALSEGFVDKVGYRDEVYASVREAWGQEAKLQYAGRYGGSVPSMVMEKLGTKNQPAIAVVNVTGGIVTGRGRPASPFGGPEAGSEVVCEHLRQAQKDDTVKAVILSVDSPGGSYIASDTIRREVVRTSQLGKPVVAFMGDVAASGGYFVSMGANEIVVTASTLTGSIGVFAGKMVTQGLYDKLGLVRDEVQNGRYAGMFAGNHGFTDEQWQVLNAWLDEVYDDFTGKAALDRKMLQTELEPLARGRVWTGADAKERHLVDHIGGRELAVERVCALADLDREKVQLKPVPLMGLLDRFQPAESSEQPGGLAGAPVDLGSMGPEAMLRRLGSVFGLEVPGVLALPYRIRIS